MSKKIKAMELDALRGALGEARDFILIEPLKVDAATDYTFRKTLREKKIRVQMVKNSYAKKIFGEVNLDAGNVWERPTLLCYGGANVKELATTVDTAIKESKKDAKSPDKFKVKTALADGQVVTLEDAKKMPTREEALGGILSAILAPGANLLAAIGGPGSTLLSVVKAIEEKAEKGGESAPTEPAAEVAAPDVAG